MDAHTVHTHSAPLPACKPPPPDLLGQILQHLNTYKMDLQKTWGLEQSS